jgi:predicted AAA+ superfamily ATPase
VKTAIDADRAPGRFVLTGSQSFALMQGVTQSLAGRAAVVSLLPFSVDEAAGAGDRPEALEALLEQQAGTGPGRPAPGFGLADWLLRGGYPEIRANPEVDRSLWCASYVQTYLERDVRQLLRIGDLATFERFLRLAAARTGQVLNASELARDVGVSPPTVRQWLSVLQTSGVVYLLQPYFKSFGKRVIKSPKLNFLDTALASFLVGLHSPEAIMRGPSAGALFETALVASWVKAFLHRGEPPTIYYWRSRDGLEVDLVIERNAKLHALEAKATATVTPRHADALLAWRQLVGPAAGFTRIVADVDRALSIAPDVQAVPWWWS